MGSMFKSPKQPDPINVGAVAAQANAQNAQNAQQNAAYNRVNQRDAMGNTLNYSQSGTDANGNPIFQANQQLGETGQMYAGGLAGLGQQYFNTAGQGGGDSQGAFDRAYSTATANLEPRMQRQQDAKYTQLRNQGLDPTSEAFKSSTNDLALQQNEARNNLVTQLQGQMFNQGMQTRQQQMSELNPGVQFANNAISPNYASTPNVNVGNVDIAGLSLANQQQQQQNYQQQMQQRNAMMGGLAGLGGSLLMAPITGGGSLGGYIGSQIIGR